MAAVVAAAPSVVLMPFRLTTAGGKAPLEAKRHISIDLPGPIHCRHGHSTRRMAHYSDNLDLEHDHGVLVEDTV